MQIRGSSIARALSRFILKFLSPSLSLSDCMDTRVHYLATNYRCWNTALVQILR